MTEKLKFTPVEEHVVLEFPKLKNSKVNDVRRVEIALDNLQKCATDTLERYFMPVYNMMIEMRAREEELAEQNRTIPASDEGPEAA